MAREFLPVHKKVVLALDKTDEIARDRLTHVQELEEGVLTVGTWFAKIYLSDIVVWVEDRRGLRAKRVGGLLVIALAVALLQPSQPSSSNTHPLPVRFS